MNTNYNELKAAINNITLRRFNTNRCQFITYDSLLILALAYTFNFYPYDKIINEDGTWKYVYRYETVEQYQEIQKWYNTVYQPGYKELRASTSIEDARWLAQEVGDSLLNDEARKLRLRSAYEENVLSGRKEYKGI